MKIYTTEELKVILEKHAKWLRDDEGGEHANLRYADLRDANLQDADLRYANLKHADLQHANLQHADLQHADLRYADLQHADLQDADLRYANLQHADLRDADLQGADLDFSCLPLWCGGSRFKADAKLVRQIIAHVSTFEIVGADDELKAVLEAMRGEAKKSHRASDLGLDED